jgi:peptidyl-prolyl cis-trans isomerase A (cyclophilin A)
MHCALFCVLLACASAAPPFLVEVKVQTDATTTGAVVLEVHPDWAPLGAARFKELVEAKFYDDCRFFRNIKGFMVQFGINGDPDTQKRWSGDKILDDPVVETNRRGFVSFAMSGKDTRTSQLFINTADNAGLDGQGFSPFAKVIVGMDVVDKLYSGYGEGAPSGKGPSQGTLQMQGNSYLTTEFPLLSYIIKANLQGANAVQAKPAHPMVHCSTSKGPVVIEMRPDWAPIGAERFLAMVSHRTPANFELSNNIADAT